MVSLNPTLFRESRQSMAHAVVDSALGDRYPARTLSLAAQARKRDVEARLEQAIAEQRRPCADGATRRHRIETFLNCEATWLAWDRIGWELPRG